MNHDGSVQTDKFSILIVDDHPIVCRGLRELVADEPDLEVCGEAEDVPGALQQVKDLRPDVAVIDLSLKGGHGLELIQEIKANHQGVKMLVSSMHDESLYAERVLRAGALGYIGKQESPDKIMVMDYAWFVARTTHDWSSEKLKSSIPGIPIFARHHGRINVLFTDGSVRLKRPDEVNPSDPDVQKTLWNE